MVSFKKDTTLYRKKVFFDANQSLAVNPLIVQKGQDNFFFCNFDKALSKQVVIAKVKHLKSNNKDVLLKHAFINVDETYQSYDNRIVVKLADINDSVLLAGILSTYNAEIITKSKRRPGRFVVEVNDYDALDVSNKLFEIGIFEYCSPVWRRMLKKMCVNDDLWDNMWGFNNTGQNGGTVGVDVGACDAWISTRGSNNITVAVLDEGVDLEHPDLQANIIGGFDATGRGSNGAPENDDAHGTACAGIIAAVQDNDEGVSGIAPNCRIMPIRIAFGSDGWWITDDEWIANAIEFAVDNGADILSNSWGGGVASDDIIDQLEDALDNGRDGNGCVVVFSAGNSDTGVLFPANSNLDIIAVGAIDRCGIRSGREDIIDNSCDPWCANCQPGSCFGDELDIVAPGSTISTTDIEGDDGYENGDYTDEFGGTSAACPHVAGIAALILSVNSGLTQQEVSDIIESTAQKTGGYNYQTEIGRPNGTWHEEVGYGLIDAFAAVQAATCNHPIENTTYSSDVTINGCANITITNGEVENGATVNINNLGNNLLINGTFYAELGTILNFQP